MAARAGQTLLRVNVLAELVLCDSQRCRHRGVAIQARVHSLPVSQTCSEHDQAGQEGKAGRDEPNTLFRNIAIDTHHDHVNKCKDA